MPRRIYTYEAGPGWGPLNLVVTLGAFAFAIGVLLFLINVVRSLRSGELAGDNPWDAPTLEWSMSSPPPVYNFAVIPTIRSRHPLWEDRLDEGARSELYSGPLLINGRETPETTTLDAQTRAVLRMPGDSYWPFALTVALMIVFYGLLTRAWWLFGVAMAATFACCVAWLWPQHVTDRPRPGTTEDTEMEVPVGDPAPSSTGGWGMSLLIVNEAMFFAYLIFSYFYLSTRAQQAFPPDGPPDLKLVIPNTFILLGSSVTAWWASRGLDRNNQGRLRAGLIVTIILGIVFLGIQAIEYSAKSSGPDASAYASSFFTTTGFHGAHVLIGLLMLGVILIRAFRGHFTSRDHLAVSNVILYWHFVDAVWLVVFSSLYLAPRMM